MKALEHILLEVHRERTVMVAVFAMGQGKPRTKQGSWSARSYPTGWLLGYDPSTSSRRALRSSAASALRTRLSCS